MQLALSLAIGVYCHARLVDSINNEKIRNSDVIPTAQALRSVSLGFDQILADYYWLKLINYVGDIELQKTDRFLKAVPLVELVAGLDPHFVSVYWFAAFTIGGDQRNPEKAAEILEFGIQKNPDNWYLPFIAGVNQYLYAGSETAGARYYRLAASYPGAPSWLGRQAQILEAKAPRLVKEANSWLSIYESNGNGPVKEKAKGRCIWLWAQVFKNAPNDDYRQKAKDVLTKFGVDIEAISNRRHSY